MVDSIYSSDVVLLCLSDVQDIGHLEGLLNRLGSHPNVVISCNCLYTPTTKAVEDLSLQIQSLSNQDHRRWPVLALSIKKVEAAHANLDRGTHARDINAYAQAFVASGLSTISDHLEFAIDKSRVDTNVELSTYVARQASQNLIDENAKEQAILAEGQDVVTQLYQKTTATNEKLQTDFKIDSVEVAEAGSQGRPAFEAVLSRRLTWYKLPFGRADDVYGDLVQASHSFFREYENQVRYRPAK